MTLPIGYLVMKRGHTTEFSTIDLTDGDRADGWTSRAIYPEDHVPQDVATLVIAARIVAYGDQPATADEIRALDLAAEAFAGRVDWEDQPSVEAA